MRLSLIALTAAGALALAAPASAQMVNGLSGPNWSHDAPIGTKAGGAMSTMAVPGEAAAINGAIKNELVARGVQPLSSARPMRASAPRASLRQRTALRTTPRVNEHAMAEQARIGPDPVGDFYQGGTFCGMEFSGDRSRIIDWNARKV